MGEKGIHSKDGHNVQQIHSGQKCAQFIYSGAQLFLAQGGVHSG